MTAPTSLSPPADALQGAGLLDRVSKAGQWALLLPLSGLLAWLLEIAAIPAALLIGPMAAGVVLAVNGGTIRVWRPAYLTAQGIIACMIAAGIETGFLAVFLAKGPLLIGAVLAAIGISGVLGAILTRMRLLPGTTAIWGTSAGSANAMILLAETHGADMRLVAFMQYVRILFVALVASLVARFLLDAGAPVAPPADWFPPVHWPALAETLVFAMVTVALAQRLRLPAGTVMLPLLAGTALHLTGFLTIELPPWLRVASYALIGWTVGLGFTRAILAHAVRALPAIVASVLALIGLCGLVGYALSRYAGIDALTAYLATSPGGADSIAIIAASSPVDMTFVMTLQTLRLIIMIFAGPGLARFVARATRV